MSNKFLPNLTPKEIIEAGAFGGCYFGVNVKITSKIDYDLLFESTLQGVDKSLYLSKLYNIKINKFKTNAGMDYQYWWDKGWIHEDDPYGWVEWYLKGRWRKAIYKKIHESGDWNISPRIQQSLLHWGYQVNETDYQLYLNSLG